MSDDGLINLITSVHYQDALKAIVDEINNLDHSEHESIKIVYQLAIQALREAGEPV